MLQPKIAPRPAPGLAPGPAPSDPKVRLSEDLYAWWNEEQTDWDDQLPGGDAADLWASMPVVDSKTVARMAPVFEKHEGRPFDVRRIRRGGYASIDDAIRHLVYETTPEFSGPAKHVPRKVDS